nr:MAG TPA: hypothetical protein [Caudoviricetes sp.]
MSLGLVKRRSFMLGYDWNTVNGTGNISLSKSMKSNFRNVEILGNSRHKTYAGTQLFDASKFSTTSAGGATLTNNGDGSFTISGTGNSNSELYIDYVYTHEETIELLKAGSITIKTSSVSNPRVDVSLRKADGIYVGLSNRYNPVDSVEIKQEFLDDPNSKLMLSFYMPSNSEIKPGTIRPMLYQDGAGEWEPFTGGKPVTEPSLDIPLEIKSAGRKSKNLLNFKDTSGTNNGINYIYKNGIITLNGTSSVISVLPSTTIPIVAGDYTVSGGSKVVPVYAKVKTKNDEVKYYLSTFTLEGNEKSCIIYPQIASGVTVNEVIKPMLNKGKTAEPFEPYSDGYLLDVKVTGRNILSDVKDMYNIFVPCLIKAGTTVTLITNGVESDGGNILFATDSGEDYWYAIDKGVTKVARSINKNVIGFKNLLSKKDGLKYCLVIGDTDKYEPYTEQSMQIALNEPLRGIGEYKDVLTKDGVVRRIKEVVITADTPITCMLGQYGAPETNTVICRYHDTSLKKTGAILCGELKNINNWIVDKESVFMTEQGIDFRLSRERLGLGSNTTPEENKAAVIKYLENHPLHCIAELNEPITEPLPESVQQQLQALHSENGTTHVFVDSGEVEAGIEATYKMKSN